LALSFKKLLLRIKITALTAPLKFINPANLIYKEAEMLLPSRAA